MILIAIGANLAAPGGTTPIETCRAALPSIAGIEGLSLVAVSAWYRSTAIPNKEHPDYCNGAIRLEGEADPVVLLRTLNKIEAEFGRERGIVNAPRTLDLDIIDLNGLVRDFQAPILPHPRAHLRAFVLRPILDIAPFWRHPVLGQNVLTLLSELPPQGIRPWGDEG